MELTILCIKIFLIRIVDVSLGTVRTVLTVRDKNFLASIIGFFVVFLWFVIVKDALSTSNNSIFIALSYSLGFATGTYVGGLLSKYLTNKNRSLCVQIIIDSNKGNLINILYNQGFALSIIKASGYYSLNKLLLFVEIDSSRYKRLKQIVTAFDDKAFMVISNSKEVYNGYFASNVK